MCLQRERNVVLLREVIDYFSDRFVGRGETSEDF